MQYLISFLEGVITFISPCLLPMLPVYVSYFAGGGERSIRKTLGTQFCRRCNYCAPCAVGINIPMVLLVEGYLSRYGLSDWAAQRYATLDKKASDCIECGLCETRCPYQLPIRQLLKNAAEKLEK